MFELRGSTMSRARADVRTILRSHYTPRATELVTCYTLYGYLDRLVVVESPSGASRARRRAIQYDKVLVIPSYGYSLSIGRGT